MIYSDADLRGAVEAARQYILAYVPAKQWPRWMHMTPEEFYAEVMEFARRRLSKPR